MLGQETQPAFQPMIQSHVGDPVTWNVGDPGNVLLDNDGRIWFVDLEMAEVTMPSHLSDARTATLPCMHTPTLPCMHPPAPPPLLRWTLPC